MNKDRRVIQFDIRTGVSVGAHHVSPIHFFISHCSLSIGWLFHFLLVGSFSYHVPVFVYDVDRRCSPYIGGNE